MRSDRFTLPGVVLITALALIGIVSGLGEFVAEFRLTGLLVVFSLALVYAARNRLHLFLRPRRHRTGRTAVLAVLLLPPGLACFYLVSDLYVFYLDPSGSGSGASQVAADPIRDRSGQTIQDVSWVEADLSHVDFSDARFKNVDLDRATLDESLLRGAVFQNVNFSAASLCGVDLRNADLRGAINLQHVADWNFAVYDDKTLWPKKFNIENKAGPIRSWTGSQLYSCEPGTWGVRPLAS